MPKAPIVLDTSHARAIWLRAQRLDQAEPFGSGPEAALAAINHLGYVQIDTINVIERCHHHILWSRIPQYRRSDLVQLQSTDKSITEYWTHALSYVPAGDFPFFMATMKAYRAQPSAWFGTVSREEILAMTRRLEAEGPLTIRDIDNDVLVEKNHPWASRKPSKRVLQLMFYQGLVTIAARTGMVKTYDLTARHFGWSKPPRPATERQITAYKLDRALRSQGLVSLDSACHLDAPSKPALRELIESRVRRKLLLPVTLAGAPKAQHWITPAALEEPVQPSSLVHLLSPFDPLVSQRKRLQLFFSYEHLFEAYVPAEKRRMGYFALPVLLGDRIVAAIDLKADRTAKKLLVQKWSWLEEIGSADKALVDEALSRFEQFQFGA